MNLALQKESGIDIRPRAPLDRPAIVRASTRGWARKALRRTISNCNPCLQRPIAEAMTPSLHDIYTRLTAHYGPQHLWAAETPLEVLIGAVLAQNTSWKNVERVLDNLREAGLLDAQRLYDLPSEELEELIRLAGHFRLKAGRLRNLLALLIEQYDGSLERMFATNLETLRGELLAINGIGPETADSILLYAGNLPSFVIDTATQRVLKRHGCIDFSADYHQIKDHLESSFEADAPLYNEFHALFGRVGDEYCRKTPKCDTCPLADLLPEGGPLEPPEF
jgi:endonuclease III related protein